MLTVKDEYNDNLFFDKTSGTSDFITTASPGLKLERNSERLKTGLTAKIDQRFYIDNPDMNATDQDYRGNIGYMVTPRFSLGAKAGFTQDSSSDRDIETTGLVMNTSKRNRQMYGGSGKYEISETTRASFTADYSKDHYENNNENPDNPYFRDTETTSAGLVFTHDLSAMLTSTKGRFSLNYANYRFSDSLVDNYSAMVGFSRAFHELWNVSVDVGGRYSPSQFEVAKYQVVPPFSYAMVNNTEKTEGWGGVGSAAVSYRDETSSLNFSLKHDLMPASGRTGAANRTGVGINVIRRFTFELSGTLSCSYFLNNSNQGQFSAQAIDEQTFNITPGIRYDFTRDLSMDISYTYTRTAYQEEGDSDADRSLVMVRLSMQYPLFE
jgi:hypothetical protein